MTSKHINPFIIGQWPSDAVKYSYKKFTRMIPFKSAKVYMQDNIPVQESCKLLSFVVACYRLYSNSVPVLMISCCSC